MCHASMGNHEIHRCKSCDDWWPHKIYQHHFPGHIKNNNLYKNIVGTQLTALSLTDIYIYISIPFRPPPVSVWIGNPPLDAMTPHEVELEAYTERLRRWTTPPWRGGSVDRHPCEGGKKHVWERKKPEIFRRKPTKDQKNSYMPCHVESSSRTCCLAWSVSQNFEKEAIERPFAGSLLVSFGWKASLVLSPGSFHLAFIQGSKLKSHDIHQKYTWDPCTKQTHWAIKLPIFFLGIPKKGGRIYTAEV